VVSTDSAIDANHSCKPTRRQPASRGAKRAHRITSTLMCSDGARLYGRSTADNRSNIKPIAPVVGGRSNMKRNGNAA